MKTKVLLIALGFAAILPGSAAVVVNTYEGDLPDDGFIQDGSTVPWTDTRTISGISGTITDIAVRVTIAGGYNGDLYAYLSYNSVAVPLMNRLGVGTGNAFGYGDEGLSVRFTDGAANNIHFYQSVPSYSIANEADWRPDGRAINPTTSAPAAFDAAGTVGLSSFSGMSANGLWTLAIADLSGGGGQAVVSSWGLDVTAVPEPGQWALLTAIGLAALAGWRRRTRCTEGD